MGRVDGEGGAGGVGWGGGGGGEGVAGVEEGYVHFFRVGVGNLFDAGIAGHCSWWVGDM